MRLAIAAAVYGPRRQRVVGAGTVTGFVETNGTVGVLVSADITNWVLTLTAPNLRGGSPDVIDFATQTHTILSGSATTATSTQLLFDFSATGTNFFLVQAGNLWCLETGGCTGGGLGEHIGGDADGPNFTETTVHSGVVAFANVAAPEPGTLGLFGLGLAALALTRRRAR